MILVGGYKPEVAWVTNHRAKLHLKNKYLIVSLLEQKTHALLPNQYRLIRLSLVRITLDIDIKQKNIFKWYFHLSDFLIISYW
jgi:hypothetical protein